MAERIPYTRPSVTARESGYVTDAAVNGWGAHCYDYIERFEAAFRDHLGSRFAVATSSCTGAMHLGLARTSRRAQLQRIVAQAGRLGHDRLVLTGDFNEWRGVRALAAAGGDLERIAALAPVGDPAKWLANCPSLGSETL